MTHRTNLTDEELVEYFENFEPDCSRMFTRADLAEIEAAVAALDEATDPEAAQAGVEAAVVAARKRGISWGFIASALRTLDYTAVRRRYEPLV